MNHFLQSYHHAAAGARGKEGPATAGRVANALCAIADNFCARRLQ